MTDEDSSPPPCFSLVIPAYNEEDYLPRLLDTVDAARQTYRGGPEAIEVIVADNASTDRTATIAAERGCRVVPVTRRAIAAARNGGAAVARGEILCFVDADFQIHPDTFGAIDELMSGKRVVAGATGVRLERWSLGIACTYVLMVSMVVVLGMDTGVVFVRREDFETIGGYNEDRLFAEDVQFLLDMRRLGKSRGQRLHRLTEVKALSSTRKFDRWGDWHFFRMISQHLWWMLRGRSANSERLARRYWYEDR